MRVLLVNGEDFTSNSSAALCNMAYLKGFISIKCRLDVITVKRGEKNLPDGPNYFTYSDDCFYHRIYRKLKSERPVSKPVSTKTTSNTFLYSKQKGFYHILDKIIAIIRSPYGTSMVWARHAHRFSSDAEYDLVVSLSWPSISHYVVGKLLSSGKIRTKKWCQIWEDPWALDLYGCNTKKIQKSEKKLLEYPCKVLYVTPGTLEKQQKQYPLCAEKMDWLPLPSYYKVSYPPTDRQDKVFSYFGDYYFTTRNLKPFFEAVNEAGIKTYICGNSDHPFVSQGSIIVKPRMPLDELNKYENLTEVLVFVANLGGGQIPGKIYQYSATNKTILFILDGSEKEKQILKEYFGQFKRYVFCDNQKESIMNAIHKIIAGDIGDISPVPVSAFEPEQIVKSIIKRTGE